jgi:hypothetical protein
VVREVGSASPDDLGTRARAADDDLRGVHKADLFWLVMPEEGSTSTGAWVELGYALAKFPSRMMIHDCAILVSGRSRKCIFADLADHRFADHDEALAYIIGRWGRKS